VAPLHVHCPRPFTNQGEHDTQDYGKLFVVSALHHPAWSETAKENKFGTYMGHLGYIIHIWYDMVWQMSIYIALLSQKSLMRLTR